MIKDRVGSVWPIIKFVGTVSITLTGIVFCIVLAPTLGDKAWNVQNILTHVVVPVVSIVDFYVECQNSPIKKRNAFIAFPGGTGTLEEISEICRLSL